MLVKDIGLAVVIIFTHVFGLFEGHQAGNRTAIIKVGIIFTFAGALDKDDRFGFFAVRRPGDLALGGNLFKLVVGNNIRQFAETQMGQFITFGHKRTPAGSQDNGPELFTVRIELQDVELAFVVFQITFMLGFNVQFFAVFIQLHFFRQREGHVKFNLVAGFFKRYNEISGLTGDARNNGFGFNGNVVIGFKLFDLAFNDRRHKVFIRIFGGQLFADLGCIAAQR